jgi:hypothetical protein
MRRAVAPLVLLVWLAACSSTPNGPAAPIAAEQLSGSEGLDVSSARQTTLDFLDAYADAPQDGGARLAGLVVGSKLATWVHWLAVQNSQFAGTISGQPEVRSVDFAETLALQGAIGARVELGARVTFSYSPQDTDAFDRTRVLDGPCALLEIAPGDWRVVDLTRDGVPMSAGIELFRGVDRTRGDVTVTIDSLFTFAPNWQFNVVVDNRSGSDVQLDPNGVVLYTKQTEGFGRTDGATTPSLNLVPAGGTAEGILAFPLQPEPTGRIVALVYDEGGRVLRFGFPLEDFVTSAPSPSPTASATPSAGPS